MKLLSLFTLLALSSCGNPKAERESVTLPQGFVIQTGDQLSTATSGYRVKDKKTGECFFVVIGRYGNAVTHIPNSKEP